MPVLQSGSMADLVATTLKNLGRLRFTNISLPLQKYHTMSRMMKKEKVDFYDDGYNFQWDVMTGTNDSARFVGLFATDVVDVKNVMTQGNSEWRHVTWNWAMDRREKAFNSGASRIVNLIETRRISAFEDATKLFERASWTCPDVTDTVSPYGFPYWIVKNASTGFNGGAPSGYTLVGGLNPSTVVTSDGTASWKNYTAQYVSISVDDLIVKWETAADKTDFTAPIKTPDFNTGDDYFFGTTYPVYSGLKQQLRAQNDDLGYDIDPMDGKPVFRQTKVDWVPQLDADTDNPVYGINFGEMKTAGLRGEWLRETQVAQKSDQHTVSVTHTDCSFNWITRNRRCHFVLATGTSGHV